MNKSSNLSGGGIPSIILSIVIFSLILTYWFPTPLIKQFTKKYDNILMNVPSNLTNKDISCYLTIDDVPYPGNTLDPILQILDKNIPNYPNIKIILFVISSYINDDNINLLKHALKQGYILGNHGKTNSYHIKLSKEELINEIKECDKAINDIYESMNIERPMYVYRPGYGYFNKQMAEIAKSLGYDIMLGTIYPYDARIKIAKLNAFYITKHLNLENKDIIIVHDRTWTIDTLNYFFTFLNKQS